MKKLLEKLLAILAKKIIKKYQPKVVGITGSIGKTSAKEATFAVLSSKFKVRQNIKNYNNELGVPLTIIGQETGGSSMFGWLRVFVAAIKLILIKDNNYPEILVLEMGADKPGDIGYLIDIAPCTVGVVTKISPTHVEFFGSIENIAKEKQKIVTHLTKEGTAILNYDDLLVRQMSEKTKGKIIYFGHAEGAEVRAIDLINQGEGLNFVGIKFKIQYKGSVVPVFLPNVIGAHQMNAALVAASVGLAFNMNLIDVSLGLKNYHSPKGRMNLILGVKNSLIIDDSDNSSPDAARAAVEAVGKTDFADFTRKVAIVGDMLELGEMSESAHEQLGRQIAENNFTCLVAVGKYSELTSQGAKSAGLKDVFTFENSILAVEKIKSLIKDGDMILIKGSQGSRMERLAKVLMKEPNKAKDFLVRQGEEWM